MTIASPGYLGLCVLTQVMALEQINMVSGGSSGSLGSFGFSVLSGNDSQRYFGKHSVKGTIEWLVIFKGLTHVSSHLIFKMTLCNSPR